MNTTLELPSVVTHVSSVPDTEFVRPASINELRDLAYLASQILYHVSMYLTHPEEAWNIVRDANRKVCDAHSWICDGKWVGERRSA
jgi:hypothetical protein